MNLKETVEKLTEISNLVLDNEQKAKRLTEWLVANGFEMIGGGLNRKVYQSSNRKFVVKVECKNLYQNNEQTTMEIKQYLNAPVELRKYLVPILDYDSNGRWLIMAKATSITYEEYVRFNKRLQRKGFHYSDYGLSNSGRYKGKCCILDYGFPLTVNNVKVSDGKKLVVPNRMDKDSSYYGKC
jgi:hypothetical protein